MTLEVLEQYRGMRSEADAMQAEIESLYNPVASPNGKTGAGHSTTPGNPTERAALRIIERRQTLEKKHADMLMLLDAIDAWIPFISDAQVRALIRWYYLCGLTWKATSIKVYGYPCPQRAHQRVHRYFDETGSV